jgi:hypothetical protein
MARGSRLTVRLADWEIQSVRRFADENHLLPSVAVRWLIALGLASEARSRPQNFHQKPAPTRPDQIG